MKHSARQAVDDRLDKIVAMSHGNKTIERLCNEISEMCRGYMMSQTGSDIENVHWGRNEARIWAALTAAPNKTVTADSLMAAITFDRNCDELSMKNVHVYISHIRKKLKAAQAPYWIETDHTHGYRLRNEPLPANLIPVKGPRGRHSYANPKALYTHRIAA